MFGQPVYKPTALQNIQGISFLRTGEFNIKQGKFIPARALFEKAIKNGNIEAYYLLADMYRKGQGMPKKPQYATKLEKEAVDIDTIRSYEQYGRH